MEKHELVLSDVHICVPYYDLSLEGLKDDTIVRISANSQNLAVSRFRIPVGSASLQQTEKIKDSDSVNYQSSADTYACDLEGNGDDIDDNVDQDEDGDLNVRRKRRRCEIETSKRCLMSEIDHSSTADLPDPGTDVRKKQDSHYSYINIVHQLATERDQVGQQVWQGCLLLCEFILAFPDQFKCQLLLDLGAGVGLTSIIASLFAKQVFCTDVEKCVLRLAEDNSNINSAVLGGLCSAIKVRRLDWMLPWDVKSTGFQELTEDLQDEFSWSDEDKAALNGLQVLIAADVVYDDDLTEGFFRTFHRFMSKPPCKVLFIGIEKRLLFTITERDVCFPSYSHFRECLEDLKLCTQNGLQYHVEQLETDFPQYFQYNRTPQLELWKIWTSFNTS